MVKFKSVIGIACIFIFSLLALWLYRFTKGIYDGTSLAKYPEYSIHAYFFGWIGYALAIVCALIALYFFYYALSTLLAIMKNSKY